MFCLYQVNIALEKKYFANDNCFYYISYYFKFRSLTVRNNDSPQYAANIF